MNLFNLCKIFLHRTVAHRQVWIPYHMDRVVMLVVVGAVGHEERKKKGGDAATFANFPGVISVLTY